jgi:pimeloyl-ACP methyl ester carboxylesterase
VAAVNRPEVNVGPASPAGVDQDPQVPSRRSFLVGGLAVVAAGAVGVEVAGPERVLHRLGLRESPDHHVAPSGWPVDDGTLGSSHMRGSVGWAMARPPGDEPLDGAIVCLHGRNNNHRYAFDEIRVHDVAASLGARLGVAAVDGGADSYWHARRDGTDAGTMLGEDFVPLVRDRLGVSRVALIGWSMGGYGALLAFERHHELFSAVALGSAALWLHAGETSPGAFDGASDFDANSVWSGLSRVDASRVRIDCGTHDPFLNADRELARRLGGRVTASFTDGYHDARFWRSVAPEQVHFLEARLTSAS